MGTEELLIQAEDLLKPWTRWCRREQSNILTVSVSRRDLLQCVARLREAHWGYLSAITGLHLPGLTKTADEETQWSRLSHEVDIHSAPPHTGDSFVVLYHFCHGNAVLNLRVHPPSLEDASVPSICNLIPSATLYERELQEMFGIRVDGTPNDDRLLLPDEWPQGVYPLRKSSPSRQAGEIGG